MLGLNETGSMTDFLSCIHSHTWIRAYSAGKSTETRLLLNDNKHDRDHLLPAVCGLILKSSAEADLQLVVERCYFSASFKWEMIVPSHVKSSIQGVCIVT